MKFRKRSELAVWILSLLLGFAGTCLYAGHTDAGMGTGTDGGAETGAEAYAPLRREQAAWWGGLYPDYCLPGAMEAVEPERDGTPEASGISNQGSPGETSGADGTGACRVKIRFKYLTFLNEKLEE